MAGKPTYNELERTIRQLEKEVLEYLRKAKELNKERKVIEYSHIRRTRSLMNINEELNREIKELKRSDTEELGLVSHRNRERIKELNSLYDISSFRDAADFSLVAVLQAVVDFIYLNFRKEVQAHRRMLGLQDSRPFLARAFYPSPLFQYIQLSSRNLIPLIL
jgi:hypothetical protein